MALRQVSGYLLWRERLAVGISWRCAWRAEWRTPCDGWYRTQLGPFYVMQADGN